MRGEVASPREGGNWVRTQFHESSMELTYQAQSPNQPDFSESTEGAGQSVAF